MGIAVKNLKNGARLTFTDGSENILYQGTSRIESITLGNAGTYLLRNIENVRGSSGADIVTLQNPAQGVGSLNLGRGYDVLKIEGSFIDARDTQLVNIEEVVLAADNLTLSLSAQTEGFIIQGFAAGASAIVGGSGNDTLTGGMGNDTLNGGAGVDRLHLGVDSVTDTVRAAEGDGVILTAVVPNHPDVDHVYEFVGGIDKFTVSGAASSVVLGGVGVAQTPGSAFADVATGTFDLNGTIAGAFITGANAGNLRDYITVSTAIGTLQNEAQGAEAYFVLVDGGGTYGIYHFVSTAADGVVGEGELELLGMLLGASESVTAADFLFY